MHFCEVFEHDFLSDGAIIAFGFGCKKAFKFNRLILFFKEEIRHMRKTYCYSIGMHWHALLFLSYNYNQQECEVCF